MTRYLSGDSTVYSALSVVNDVTASVGRFTSTLSVDDNVRGGALGSFNTLSMGTAGGSAVTSGAIVPDGNLWITVGVSGLSVGIESGGSLYWINSTTSG
jgi:hypothetical protein